MALTFDRLIAEEELSNPVNESLLVLRGSGGLKRNVHGDVVPTKVKQQLTVGCRRKIKAESKEEKRFR